DLVKALAAAGWEPRYFDGTIRIKDEGWHLALAKKAIQEPATRITVGRTTYATSSARIAAGKEIFHTYHFGTQRLWDFRRAIADAAWIPAPDEFRRRCVARREREGYFGGLVGVRDANGHLACGHACALCHSGPDEKGEIVDGVPNHAYDIGLYYDAIRPKV